MKNYDLIIVGAGPAGYFCAYEMMEKNPRLPETTATGITTTFIPGLKRWNPEFKDDYQF